MIGNSNAGGMEGGGIPWPTRGMREEDRLELLLRHGQFDVRQAFLTLANRYKSGSTVLRRYRVHYTNRGEETQPKLIGTRPWDRNPERASLPPGHHEGAFGATQLWVDYFHLAQPPFLGFKTPEDAAPGSGSPGPFLEISCLTWSYEAMGDFETSLVIGLWRDSDYLPLRSAAATPYGQAAAWLMEQMAAFLEANPPSPQAVQNREALALAAIQAEEEKRRIEEQARIEAGAAEEARRDAVIRAQEMLRRGPGRSLAVIYDASYLMDGRRDPIDISSGTGAYHITAIVSEETKQEIANHLKGRDPRKAEDASKARSRIVRLMEAAKMGTMTYREVRCRNYVSPQSYPESLVDVSPTDSLLIEYGKYLIDHENFRAVMVTSLDGDIRNVVFRYREQTGQPLFCVANLKDLPQVKPLRDWFAQTSSVTAAVWSVQAEDAVENGIKGLRIHTNFSIDDCQGLQCGVIAAFTKEGMPLKDANELFTDRWGEVAAYGAFTPIAPAISIADHQLFIPYHELHLPNGSHEIVWRVGIFTPTSCLTWSENCTLRIMLS